MNLNENLSGIWCLFTFCPKNSGKHRREHAAHARESLENMNLIAVFHVPILLSIIDPHGMLRDRLRAKAVNIELSWRSHSIIFDILSPMYNF